MNKMGVQSMLLSFFLLLLATFAVAVAVAAAPAFVLGHILPSASSTTRTILQATKVCPVDFEFLNYTIMTSKCKGPEYPANLCCSALAEFACPYAKYLNDLTNDCASTMFSYIHLYGKYPNGLFSTLCQGLGCSPPSPILDTCHVQKITISHIHPL